MPPAPKRTRRWFQFEVRPKFIRNPAQKRSLGVWAMRSLGLVSLVLLVFGILVVGCDPVRTTKQTLRIQVLDLRSGMPLAGARLEVKEDFDGGQASLPIERRLTGAKLREAREFWDGLPWSTCTTDYEGNAECSIVQTMLDRTRGQVPPRNRDNVTDVPFLIRIHPGNASEEALSIRMSPGHHVEGTCFRVDVLGVQKPEYIPTHSAR